MVTTMRIIVCTKRIVSKSLGKPKNLLPFEMWSAIKKGRSRSVIFHNNCQSSRITRPLGLLFIPVRSMTNWTPLQILSIQCRLFESMNVIVRHCCVQTNVVIPDCCNQMLCIVLAKMQVGMSAHSSSLNFCRSKERKHQKNLKCYNGKGKKL